MYVALVFRRVKLPRCPRLDAMAALDSATQAFLQHCMTLKLGDYYLHSKVVVCSSANISGARLCIAVGSTCDPIRGAFVPSRKQLTEGWGEAGTRSTPEIVGTPKAVREKEETSFCGARLLPCHGLPEQLGGGEWKGGVQFAATYYLARFLSKRACNSVYFV